GLGLSISKELSKLLGGELQLKSEEGKGSTFTCYLPEVTESKINPDEIPERRKSTDRRKHPTEKLKMQKKEKTKAAQSIADDRKSIKKGDKTILVIEDDLNFAKTLKTVCEERNFKYLHASDGESGLKLASEFIPDGIILDIGLPGIDGWEVLEILKANNDIRHIPVHIMSALDKTIDAFQKGAVGFLTKPVNNEQLGSAFERIDDFRDKKNKNMLIVEDNEILRKSVIQLLEDENVTIDDAKDGKSVIEKLHSTEYDCMILDLSLPDITGFDLLKILKNDKKVKSIPPVIVYTGTEISKEEEFELRKYAKSIIIKGVKSEERLIDETALFLHQVVSEMPEDKQKIISKLHDTDSLFIDKKILVVDDDMRNVFAVSAALEEKEMLITSAANGQKALDILKEDPKFDMILMDIMMPIMDGYETMGHIRKDANIKDIPIIALTAKAMKGDKEKCIESGANDYLTKPLNVERLLSLMRVWMYK
ncbi:MAG: response regulator, partial [Candidatus Cloacimonetes bacterium]|nr:response regulator [Candidatus Cloacimonadota bacterium]